MFTHCWHPRILLQHFANITGGTIGVDRQILHLKVSYKKIGWVKGQPITQQKCAQFSSPDTALTREIWISTTSASSGVPTYHSNSLVMSSSRFAPVDGVCVSREGQSAVEIVVAQLTQSSVARVFSVSLHRHAWTPVDSSLVLNCNLLKVATVADW